MNILNSINHIKYTAPPIFTPFQFTIAGGTNFTGTANQYPITFNSSTTSNTYGIITNFTGQTVKGTSFTIYVKGICNETYRKLREPVLISFFNTSATSTTFLTVGRVANNLSLTSALYHNNALQVYVLTTNVLSYINDIFHTFMVFNSVNMTVSIYFYSNTGTLLYSNIQYPILYNTIMDPFNVFTFAKCRGDTTTNSNITIYAAGWYNYAVSSTIMSSMLM
jgi:hypothetical protein